MLIQSDSNLLSPTELPAARALNSNGLGQAVLVCEHASRFIPASLNNLELDDEASTSHAAWDIGAMDLSIELMGALDAPLVHSRVSRLVYDCNRPPERADSIPTHSERFEIPGNAGLNADQIKQRARDVYHPFRTLLADVIASRSAQPVLITIHSFTPIYNGTYRDVELGILHDNDDLAASILMEKASKSELKTALNEPYSATDGVTHTLREQAIKRGIPNVMLEVRNDLIDTPSGVNRIAGLLSPILQELVSQLSSEEASK